MPSHQISTICLLQGFSLCPISFYKMNVNDWVCYISIQVSIAQNSYNSYFEGKSCLYTHTDINCCHFFNVRNDFIFKLCYHNQCRSIYTKHRAGPNTFTFIE